MKPSVISNTLPANFPKTAAERARVIAAAPGEHRAPTTEELAQMERSVMVYGGGPLAVREALAKRRRELEQEALAEHVPA